jgi:hypothetical protein
MQWKLRINSTLNIFCKSNLETLFSNWSSNIFTIKILYLVVTHFDGNIVHGNLVGFSIPQIFVTFGVVESCKILQLKDFLKTSCKVGEEGLQLVF